jgi:hypothetical protein
MKIIRTWYENEYFYFCSMILRRLMNMSKKIATLITNLFEDVEYTEPVQAFKEAGHEVITIDKQSGNEVTGKKGTTVKIDKSIDEVHPADFDAAYPWWILSRFIA